MESLNCKTMKELTEGLFDALGQSERNIVRGHIDYMSNGVVFVVADPQRDESTWREFKLYFSRMEPKMAKLMTSEGIDNLCEWFSSHQVTTGPRTRYRRPDPLD